MIEHILKSDFPLPAIQTVPHSLFGHPTQEARERMRGLNPEFTTGRFDHYEDAVIVQRIKALFTVRPNTIYKERCGKPRLFSGAGD